MFGTCDMKMKFVKNVKTITDIATRENRLVRKIEFAFGHRFVSTAGYALNLQRVKLRTHELFSACVDVFVLKMGLKTSSKD